MPSTASRPLRVVDLGRTPYRQSWELQKALVERIADGLDPDTLLLVEHDPVVTLGRGTAAGPVPAGVEVIEVERGGQATYLAPGQVVGYPLLRLEGPERDLHRLLRELEEVLIRALATFGLVAARKPGLTGVWIAQRKIASLGIAVRRWVSYHGFALNVCPDMAGFGLIQPCGLPSAVMTSLAEHLDGPADPARARDAIVAAFAEVFDRKASWMDPLAVRF